MRLLASRVPESRRADVHTADIIRLRDTEKLSWQTIGAKLGMSGEGVRKRYRKSNIVRALTLEPHRAGFPSLSPVQ
jgi:hypothetical protein